MTEPKEVSGVLAVIDRIIDGQAVLLIGEEEIEAVVPLKALPPQSAAGNWLRLWLREGSLEEGFKEGLASALIRVERDDQATQAARARIQQKLELLRRRRRR